jgi:hypothetical protein
MRQRISNKTSSKTRSKTRRHSRHRNNQASRNNLNGNFIPYFGESVRGSLTSRGPDA